MRILFTGGSSFTGYWFAKELASAGHEVVATFRRQQEDYQEELRRKRIGLLADMCHTVFGVSFGDDQFLRLIKESKWDLLCHHAAEAANYKSLDFNIVAAVKNNTHRLPLVLDFCGDPAAAKPFSPAVFLKTTKVQVRNRLRRFPLMDFRRV